MTHMIKSHYKTKKIHVLNISIKKNKTLLAARFELYTSGAEVQGCTNYAMDDV